LQPSMTPPLAGQPICPEIEARSASSCCERPVRLRAAPQHAGGNLDNRHVEILCVASAYVNVSVLYQFVDTANRSWPTSITLAVGISFGRAARGSVALRKMACRSAARECAFAVQGHRLALEGQPSRCPFLIRTGNGRQDARPYFARRPVAVLRNFRLGGGSRCFWLSLFCARCSCGSRRSL
jgi:hypothetical protein